MTTVRCRVLVQGRVQRVWFRGACAREAAEAGVGGWVRNLPDGRVEAAFEGPRAAVERLLIWSQHGPPHAAVTGVEIIDEAPMGETSFHVQ